MKPWGASEVRGARAIPPVYALALAGALTACGSSSGSIGGAAVPSVSPSGPALTYVAVGASETLGFGADDPVRQAWTQVFYRTALPRAASLVNLGIPGATVQEALLREVPEAERARPDVVTVWLNVNDLIEAVPPSLYREQITKLLQDLRDRGHTTVLIANTPPLGQLRRFSECEPFAPASGGGCDRTRRLTAPELEATVDAYNSAISQAAAKEGAIVVDLHALGLAAQHAGTENDLVSGDGFHPSTAGHLAIGRGIRAGPAGDPSRLSRGPRPAGPSIDNAALPRAIAARGAKLEPRWPTAKPSSC
ncbi:MAG TPA: SGNH/GDSL hydrolase family protein [Actinomycetota bacterium]